MDKICSTNLIIVKSYFNCDVCKKKLDTSHNYLYTKELIRKKSHSNVLILTKVLLKKAA